MEWLGSHDLMWNGCILMIVYGMFGFSRYFVEWLDGFSKSYMKWLGSHDLMWND